MCFDQLHIADHNVTWFLIELTMQYSLKSLKLLTMAISVGSKSKSSRPSVCMSTIKADMFTAVAPAVSQATKLCSRLVSQIIWLVSWLAVLKDLSGGTDGAIWVYKLSRWCHFQAAQHKDSKCDFLVCQECFLEPLTSNPPLFSTMFSTHHLSNLLYDKTLERAHLCLVLRPRLGF